MENLVEKLKQILSDFSQIYNPTQEQINKAKQDEFNLFGDIRTIRELCEYYKTDMEIDKMPKEFISGIRHLKTKEELSTKDNNSDTACQANSNKSARQNNDICCSQYLSLMLRRTPL